MIDNLPPGVTTSMIPGNRRVHECGFCCAEITEENPPKDMPRRIDGKPMTDSFASAKIDGQDGCKACVNERIRLLAIYWLNESPAYYNPSTFFEDAGMLLLEDGLGWKFERTPTGFTVTVS